MPGSSNNPNSLVHYYIVDRGAQAMMSAVPRVSARMLTAALRDIGRTFCYHFTAQRLGGPPGITMHKRGKGTSGSNFKIPAQMRRAGFKGTVYGDSPRARKRGIWIGTRSPVMMMHETGGRISAKKGHSLKIKIKDPITAARLHKMIGDFILIPSVKLDARLGFHDTWLAYIPTSYQILNTAVYRTVAMVNSGVRG